MNNIAVIMTTTIYIDMNSLLFKNGQLVDNIKRIEQYYEGIKRFAEFNGKYNFDTYIIDNSIPFINLPIKLQNLITVNKYKYYNNTPNNFGKDNKGAGLIQAWQDNINIFRKYKFLIFFEPRQYMEENIIIPQFLNNQTSYFCKWKKKGFETGFFIIKKHIMIKYLQRIDQKYLINIVKKNIAIENDLKKFIDNHKFNYKLVPRLHLLNFKKNRTDQI